MVKTFEFANSQEAWEGINEYFLNNQNEIIDRGGSRYGPQLISYDIFIRIRKAWVNPEFDFGNTFGYRRQKWSSLVNNYINLNYLDILKTQVLEKVKKKNANYNIAMPFDNSHDSGKNCLLALVVSRRIGIDHPIMTFYLRSSEITKRLLWDLLLVQRIAEYIFGTKEYVSINLACGNMYQNTESFIMMDNHIPLKKMLPKQLSKPDEWQKRAIETLDHFRKVDPKKVTYRVHLRSVKQLQRKDGVPLSGNRPLLAKECFIHEVDNIPYPDNCITKDQRKRFKSKYLKKNDSK